MVVQKVVFGRKSCQLLCYEPNVTIRKKRTHSFSDPSSQTTLKKIFFFEKREIVYVLHLVSGLFVQTALQYWIYFPESVCFHVSSEQWFSRWLSSTYICYHTVSPRGQPPDWCIHVIWEPVINVSSRGPHPGLIHLELCGGGLGLWVSQSPLTSESHRSVKHLPSVS